MSDSENQSKLRNPPWIWILPVAALALVLWMAYNSVISRGRLIEIAFEDGQGITAGQTVLLYRGVQVGEVAAARLSKDLSQVKVLVRLHPDADGVAVTGSKFWITRPEISLSGIRGLDTLLSGVYLQVEPGTGDSSTQFIGLTVPPMISANQELPLVLLTERAQSVQIGSPVYFRDVPVGEIKELTLTEDGSMVRIEAGIAGQSSYLVSNESRFWIESGIDVKGNLLGVKIQADSLESILKGGVSFATPELNPTGRLVEPYSIFTLYEKPDKSWLEWGGNPQVD